MDDVLRWSIITSAARLAERHAKRVAAGVEGKLGLFDREAPGSGNEERFRLVTSVVEGLMTSASPKCPTRPQ